MIPLIQREVVNNNNWMCDKEFLDMLAVAQSSPGPIAANAAVFVGYKLARFCGATAALLGVILPSFLIILLLAVFLTTRGETEIIRKFFLGVRPAIVALILGTGLAMGKKHLSTSLEIGITLIVLLIFVFVQVHPIALILLGAGFGILKMELVRRRKEGAC